MSLDANVQKIVDMGIELWEDSYTYHGIMEYTEYVGAIPDWAWGEMEWSDDWKDNWQTSLDYRIEEAVKARDKTGKHGGALMKVAADYANTDIENSYEIDLSMERGGSENLEEFILTEDAKSGKIPKVTADGKAPEPDYPKGSTPSTLENKQLQALENESAQPLRDECKPHQSSYDLSNGNVGDDLDEFAAEYGDFLHCVESQVNNAGIGSKATAPFTNVIIPAWLSNHKVIQNRAEMLSSAGQTYEQVADKMELSAESLAGRNKYWDSEAALHWLDYAKAAEKYIRSIGEESSALAKHGVKAASLIEGLRNRYAELGYEKIEHIVELAKDATEAANDLLSSDSSPWSSVSGALSDFSEGLLTAYEAKLDTAKALITIDEQERTEREDYLPTMHSVTPYPQNDVEGGDWKDGDTW